MDEINECLCGLAVAQEDRLNNSMTAVQLPSSVDAKVVSLDGWVHFLSSGPLLYSILTQIHSSFILTVLTLKLYLRIGGVEKPKRIRTILFLPTAPSKFEARDVVMAPEDVPLDELEAGKLRMKTQTWTCWMS